MRSMKYLLIVGLTLSFSLTAKAATTWIKEGKWQCQVTNSVSKDLAGKKCTATTTTKGNQTKITVVMEGAKGQEREEWVWKGNTLTQTEYDATGTVVATYGATAKGGTDTEKTFEINCTDRAAKKCDNDIDPNNKWTLKVWSDKFQYIVMGLKDKNDPKSVGQRHLFEFTYAGK